MAVQAEAEAEAALSEAHAASMELAAAAVPSSCVRRGRTEADDDEEDEDVEDEITNALRSENYETVLSLLKDADDSRRAEQVRSEEVARDALEKATLREIALTEEKAKVHELRKKLRRLESSSVCIGHLARAPAPSPSVRHLLCTDSPRACRVGLPAPCERL